MITALRNVCWKSAQSVGTELISRVQIIEGGGRRTDGTLNPRTTPSHRTRMLTPNSKGTARRTARLAGTFLKFWRTSHSLVAQAAIQKAMALNRIPEFMALIPMRLRTAVWAKPTMITKVAASAAAMNKADQICTVWP